MVLRRYIWGHFQKSEVTLPVARVRTGPMCHDPAGRKQDKFEGITSGAER